MPISTKASGIGKSCRKATAADSCPASYPSTPNLGQGGGSNPGDGGPSGDEQGSSPTNIISPGDTGSRHDDSSNPDNKPVNGDGGVERPPGLWKAKKMRRRDCGGADAGRHTLSMSSSLSDEGNGNQDVVAAMSDNTEEANAATLSKGYQDNFGGDYAFFESPGRGGIQDSLNFDLAASGLGGADSFQETPAEDQKGIIPDSVITT